MRRPRLHFTAVALTLLVLGAAGCGGGKVTADEVPGAGPQVSVPVDATLGAPAESDKSAATTSQDKAGADAGADTQQSSSSSQSAGTSTSQSSGSAGGATAPSTSTGPSTGSSGGGTSGASGGASAPAAQAPAQDEPTNDTPPPAGSDAQKFEDFCAQNKGAC